MLIKFFSNGVGGGAAPVGYLVAREVLAHDSNRDLIRDEHGQPQTIARDPLPEVLRGDPSRTEALIDASRNKWTYRAGVVSFAPGDAPTEAQQFEVMDAFERLAFAGLEAEHYDMLWVRHTHEDRVELHFCTPRLELTTGRSLNIAPPGYQTAFDSLRDLMNKTHHWADPMELERAQEVRHTIEEPTRAQGRDELHRWVLDQISVGLIEDRASMIDALTDAGFDIPRASKTYLTARDPDTGERWRLKGEIFHEDWQTDSAGRETERGVGHDTPGPRRLDGIPTGELQERFDHHCGRRAAYHRDRYSPFLDRDSEPVRGQDRTDQTLVSDLTLGDCGAELDGTRLDDGRELVLGEPDGALSIDRDGPDADRTARRELDHLGPGQNATALLQDGQSDRQLYQNGGGVDDPNSLGARLARVRRTVGDGLRNLSDGIARFGCSVDQRDRSTGDRLNRLRERASDITSAVRGYIGRIADRGAELRDAGRAVAQELELSEGRREAAERAVAKHERSYFDGMSP